MPHAQVLPHASLSLYINISSFFFHRVAKYLVQNFLFVFALGGSGGAEGAQKIVGQSLMSHMTPFGFSVSPQFS